MIFIKYYKFLYKKLHSKHQTEKFFKLMAIL